MKKTAIYQSIIQNGKMTREAAQQIAVKLAGCEGKMVRVLIEEVKKTRSLNQNAFYWGVVIPMVRGLFAEHGSEIDDEQAHIYLKEHVMGWKKSIHDPHGHLLTFVDTSTDKTTEEWEDAMTKVRAWAASFDMIIPLPNEHI